MLVLKVASQQIGVWSRRICTRTGRVSGGSAWRFPLADFTMIFAFPADPALSTTL
jgi:hypothetical protein